MAALDSGSVWRQGACDVIVDRDIRDFGRSAWS